MTRLAGKKFSPGILETLDHIIKKARQSETDAERKESQPFYDFLSRSLLETDST